ncbi:uncharacterized protein LOC124290646 [Haliotis rubra]|uniref:uncharacterized protein LOC124290646 n=1 Tax=Haliotis rubra TaxID=36100 RepID=UPI001EE5EC54|nr:uncharacterized protein LOC124290646 [Haliotis rubra]XP_046583389.1 uncharacterized protein LOC124290646 [Haliotis rubra]
MLKRKVETAESKTAKKKKQSPALKTESSKKNVQKKQKVKKNVKTDADTMEEGGKTSPYPKLIDEDTNVESDEKIEFTASLPTRNSKGQLVFAGVPEFRPNMTPKEVMHAGSFGGTYFRPIKSGATKKSYSGVWKELPKDWLQGLNIGQQLSSSTYDEKVNTYKVKCGGSLDMWESSGWIHKQDPYGWFQWYCRFYQGGRTEDDKRQIGRWLRCAGTTGRWRNNLISKCVKSGCGYDNHSISPVVRQTLQHWGYKLNKEDFDAYAKKKRLL